MKQNHLSEICGEEQRHIFFYTRFDFFPTCGILWRISFTKNDPKSLGWSRTSRRKNKITNPLGNQKKQWKLGATWRAFFSKAKSLYWLHEMQRVLPMHQSWWVVWGCYPTKCHFVPHSWGNQTTKQWSRTMMARFVRNSVQQVVRHRCYRRHGLFIAGFGITRGSIGIPIEEVPGIAWCHPFVLVREPFCSHTPSSKKRAPELSQGEPNIPRIFLIPRGIIL